MAAELSYALVQVAHNLGAAAVVGSPIAAWFLARQFPCVPTALPWATLLGWTTQILSGVAFGVTSYLSRGELPEITGVALVALYTKIACATAGFTLVTTYLVSAPIFRQRLGRWIWLALACAGLAALTAAAFLRWFG